jgi:hypothetical protein
MDGSVGVAEGMHGCICMVMYSAGCSMMDTNAAKAGPCVYLWLHSVIPNHCLRAQD